LRVRSPPSPACEILKFTQSLTQFHILKKQVTLIQLLTSRIKGLKIRRDSLLMRVRPPLPLPFETISKRRCGCTHACSVHTSVSAFRKECRQEWRHGTLKRAPHKRSTLSFFQLFEGPRPIFAKQPAERAIREKFSVS